MRTPPLSLREALDQSYPIERELGRGGSATVYLVRDLRHGRQVALKVLRPELAEALRAERRFLHEIRLTARLQHPHILPMFDSGEAAGLLWYTMPFVEGESLRDRLRRENRLPVTDAVRLTREVAEALDYAHGQGVIHRDVKPENILLSRGHALVADFGVARALELAGADAGASTGLSLSHGTPAYMSPEQAARGPIDQRSDIFSLGCVLYELLTGERLVDRPLGPAPQRLSPDVPPPLEAALRKALAESPSHRYATAGEFGQAIDVALAGTSRGGRRRRLAAGSRIVTLTVLVPLLALAVSAGRHWLSGRADPSARAAPDAAHPAWVAVLPMAEPGGDAGEAYFADGMTDAVREKLAGLPGLEVVAPASSSEYRATSKPIQQIGQELGVQYFLEGRIRRTRGPGEDGRIEVDPELVDVATGAVKWRQRFDAPAVEIFKVQTDIAAAVARELDVTLGAGERRLLAARPTRSLAAYEAFLKGEQVSNRMAEVGDPTTVGKALGYYAQAVALDSSYALAWTRLSQAQATLIPPTSESWKASYAAAQRAMALSPTGVEGRLALGEYYYMSRHFEPALEQYALGLRIAPHDPDLLVGTGMAQQSLGQWRASVAYLQEALTLDPRSVKAAWRLAHTLYYLRRYPEALAACDRGLAFAPTNLTLLEYKAMIYLAEGDLTGARLVIRSAPPEVDRSTLVAFTANMYDLSWLLDDEQQRLLLTLDSHLFGSRAIWALDLAETYDLRHRPAAVRAYADSSIASWEPLVRDSPGDAEFRVMYGLALAYAGRSADAIREGERAVATLPIGKDHFIGAYVQHQLVRIYTVTGRYDEALDRLEPLLTLPYILTPAWLRIDPTFAPLRRQPRFQRLLRSSAAPAG
jgi:TolB-like protein/tRNA A-37 threonylcarbamoyl transferase component Bud32/Flp pilus assembly protein TadD